MILIVSRFSSAACFSIVLELELVLELGAVTSLLRH
jgi:hypothetical protein